jgi:hypothetical protein
MGDFSEGLRFNFDSLPDDPRDAFIELERYFASELEADLYQAQSAVDRQGAYIRYMSKTIAAGSTCGIDIADEWETPSHGSEHSVVDYVKDFEAAIHRAILQIKITSAWENRADSYVLSGPDKEKIRHLVDRIKQIIDVANLPVDKHDSLFGFLDKFLRAVDQQRTNPQAISALLIGLAQTGGEMAKKLKPARDLVISIAKVFTPYQERDEAKRQIPAPTERRRIEHKPITAPSKQNADEDEIPF